MKRVMVFAAYKIVSQALFRAAGPWFQETEGAPWKVPSALAYEVWTPIAEFGYAEVFRVVRVSDLGF